MHEHVKETFSCTCSLKVYINCYHHLCISWVTSTTATTKRDSYTTGTITSAIAIAIAPPTTTYNEYDGVIVSLRYLLVVFAQILLQMALRKR